MKAEVQKLLTRMIEATGPIAFSRPEGLEILVCVFDRATQKAELTITTEERDVSAAIFDALAKHERAGMI